MSTFAWMIFLFGVFIGFLIGRAYTRLIDKKIAKSV